MTNSSTLHRPVQMYWCPKCRRYFAETTRMIHEIDGHSK